MKNIYKIFALSGALVLGLGSCSEADNTIDEVFDGVSSGAVLRTIDIINTELPIGIDDALFGVVVEAQDEQEGALLGSVDVYVTFADNSEQGDSSGGITDEVLVRNIPAANFEAGPFGLPRTEIIVTLNEMLSLTGLETANIFGDDTFTIRLAMNLTDGRVFSVDNAGGIITGGFFSSPFQYVNKVVCLVDNDDFFSGSYLLEELTGNVDPFGGNYGPHYPPSQNITIEGSGSVRTFEYIIYPDSFVFGQLGTITLNCGKIEFTSTGSGGTLGCTGGANTIEDIHAEPKADYDLELIDDTVFEFDVLGFGQDDGGCDVGSYEIRLKFSKQ